MPDGVASRRVGPNSFRAACVPWQLLHAALFRRLTTLVKFAIAGRALAYLCSLSRPASSYQDRNEAHQFLQKSGSMNISLQGHECKIRLIIYLVASFIVYAVEIESESENLLKCENIKRIKK
ncbi:hypothetical protein LJR034_000929 [Caballeronia sp. LjRoot34]|uniref:hypothetical protein n=1 Tax=Caballeronia sp. LjRoot34 TaxID=3342325 RepID=UPI003ED04F45